MAFIKVGDIDIWYQLQGSGPRLLFIDGTGRDLRVRPNATTGPLAEEFELLAFDQRGLGQSSRPDEPYTMAGYGADAAGLVKALGWPDCAVIGYSFGGMVAQELAINFPGLVKRLVLISTSSGGAGGSSYPLHELASLPIDQQVKKLLELADTRRTAAWQKAHPQEWTERVNLVLSNMKTGADEPNRAAGAKRQLEARLDLDTFDRLSRIKAPTLVCGGSSDGLVNMANHQALVQAIPEAELMMFEGGHGFFEEDPALLRPIIDFLKA